MRARKDPENHVERAEDSGTDQQAGPVAAYERKLDQVAQKGDIGFRASHQREESGKARPLPRYSEKKFERITLH